MNPDTTPAGEGLLDYAHSRLVAVFDAHDRVDAAVAALASAGFAESFDVQCGVAGARLIDFSGRDHGPLARLSHALHELTAEGSHMQHYERELNDGHCVITVRTKDADHRQRALDILVAHQGHFINQFGTWTVETLQP
jgi:hypothetical protein